MSMTVEQEQAVKARGKVLVSASAGAGKTTVMIKRMVDILEKEASLDNVLAVTFTKKAAAQMKEKLRRELIERLAECDGNQKERMRLQLAKINAADISTIDSFCARLVRTYFYALKVDASFEVLADDAEKKALMERTLDDLFEELYKERDADFYYLLERLSSKRSDKKLREWLFKMYEEVRQRPRWKELVESTCDSTFTEEGFGRVCAELKKNVSARCAALAQDVDAFAATCKPAAHAKEFADLFAQMSKTLKGLASSCNPFAMPNKLRSINNPDKSNEEIADFIDSVKKRYDKLRFGKEDEERELFFNCGAVAKAFCSVLFRFDEKYGEVKREEGKLDYADLEHYTLSLLTDADGDVRESIREKYKYVFVDEYQDVNAIQDEILNAVAGGDIFCVGDLKQAIYGFRGSCSRFFAEKCAEAQADRTAGGKSEYIVLPDNFRSSENVISFVNKLFSSVMRPPVCGFDYASGHAMRGGERYAGNKGIAEICKFDGGGKTKQEAQGVYCVTDYVTGAKPHTPEGLAVLSLVEEALGSEYYDVDNEETKEVRPGVFEKVKTPAFKKVQTGDICVLTRLNFDKNAEGIIRALSERYPVACSAKVNICNRPEIKRMLDILSYIDNGEQDIPFVSALLSPLGNLSEGELAAVRIFADGQNADKSKRPRFTECCKMYADGNNDGISDKLREFEGRVENLRKLSKSIGASRLIDEIMRVAGFSATFDNERKITALRRLQREAATPSGELYLGAFLQKIKAGGNVINASSALSSDCIKVMTMHSSKGLEFPVVILADIAGGFGGGRGAEFIFGDDFGFAPRSYTDGKKCCENVLRKLYKMRGDWDELGNEINLFYVACTRAKYALHVLTSKTESFNAVKAKYASNYADLFDADLFTPGILPVERSGGKVLNTNVRVVDTSRADAEYVEKLREIADFKYPFELGVELPVKSSASQLLALIGGEDAGEVLFDEGAVAGADTGIEAGLAYHRFLQLCNFKIKHSEGIESQLEKFKAAGLIGENYLKHLRVQQLENILKMSVFDGLENYSVYREREFICKLPSADYLAAKGACESVSAEDDGNGVIVQGAIDMLAVCRKGGKVTSARIVDYKYTSHGDDHLKNKYTPQLQLYKKVVCKIYGLNEKAVSCTIANIYACRRIDLDI